MTTQDERIEALESAVADMIPREELSAQLSAAFLAASATRDIAKRVEILLGEKIIPMVEEDHRTLRGKNGMPGLVTDVLMLTNCRRNVDRLGWWAAPTLLGFLGMLLWALLTHKVVIAEAAHVLEVGPETLPPSPCGTRRAFLAIIGPSGPAELPCPRRFDRCHPTALVRKGLTGRTSRRLSAQCERRWR
jgi:hypothetical protein